MEEKTRTRLLGVVAVMLLVFILFEDQPALAPVQEAVANVSAAVNIAIAKVFGRNETVVPPAGDDTINLPGGPSTPPSSVPDPVAPDPDPLEANLFMDSGEYHVDDPISGRTECNYPGMSVSIQFQLALGDDWVEYAAGQSDASGVFTFAIPNPKDESMLIPMAPEYPWSARRVRAQASGNGMNDYSYQSEFDVLGVLIFDHGHQGTEVWMVKVASSYSEATMMLYFSTDDWASSSLAVTDRAETNGMAWLHWVPPGPFVYKLRVHAVGASGDEWSEDLTVIVA